MTSNEVIEALTLCVDWAEYREETFCDCVPVEVLETARNILKQYVNRPTGEWIEDGYFDEPCVCSWCGAPGDKSWHFCPHCGAKIKTA